jgi:FeS assembly SUF system regulator
MIILSKLADYGVIVATHLAAGAERQMTAAALAGEAKLPRATVAKVLKALAHAGIVTGARGASGGYRLARPAASVSIAEVVAAIDGGMSLTQCTSHNHHEPTCQRSDYCMTRPHWHRINAAVGTALGAITVADMASPFGGFAPQPAAPRSETARP